MRINNIAIRRCRLRQRGSAYIFVLGITTMLMVLGLASSLLSRVMLEQNNLESVAAQSSLSAVSALDIMHKRIDGSSSWRSFVSNDTWSGAESFGDGQVEFKFVDEDDANLANDATQMFRLYARVKTGQAVRVYSVAMRPDGSGGYTRDARTLRREVASIASTRTTSSATSASGTTTASSTTTTETAAASATTDPSASTTTSTASRTTETSSSSLTTESTSNGKPK